MTNHPGRRQKQIESGNAPVNSAPNIPQHNIHKNVTPGATKPPTPESKNSCTCVKGTRCHCDTTQKKGK